MKYLRIKPRDLVTDLTCDICDDDLVDKKGTWKPMFDVGHRVYGELCICIKCKNKLEKGYTLK